MCGSLRCVTPDKGSKLKERERDRVGSQASGVRHDVTYVAVYVEHFSSVPSDVS